MNKLFVENVVKVEVEGTKTTIHVEKGTSVVISFDGEAVRPSDVEEVISEEPEELDEPKEAKKEVPRKPKKKKTKPKKEEPVKEVSEELKEAVADVEELVESPEDEVPWEVEADVEELPEAEEEGGFTELEEEEISSINDIFNNSSVTANAIVEEPEPKEAPKKNVFALGGKAKEESDKSTKNPFNF